MSTILTSSQLTFVDITDQRKLSAYLTSNRTTVQIYNSEATTKYNPDWSTNNLEITPQVFLDQQPVSITEDSNLTINWKRKDGNEAETELKSNEKKENNILKVSGNNLGDSSSDMITYICYVSYYDTETKQTVDVTTQLSYTLIRAAENAKSCSITGEQVFAYDTNGVLKNTSGQITLTGSVQGVTINKWQYYDSIESAYKDYQTGEADTSSILNVKASDEIFDSAGIAKIKLTTKDSSGNLVPDVYDIFTITKIYDGAQGGTGGSGKDAYTVLLTNECYTFPGTTDAAKDGSVTTSIVAYKGTTVQTATIKSVDGKTATSGNTNTTGLTYSIDGQNITFTAATTLTAASGTVSIIVTADSIDFTRVFSWSVAYTGSGASSLNIEYSSQIFKSSDGSTFSPDTITLTPNVQNLALSSVSWKYSIDGGSTWTNVTNTTTSTTEVYYDNTTKVLTVPKGLTLYTATVTSIVFRCVSGDFTDSVTIARLSDGQSASAAYTAILSNEMQGIATDTSLKPIEGSQYSCTITVYKGTELLSAVGESESVSSGKFKVIRPSNPKGITLAQGTAGTVTFTTSTSTAIDASGTIDLTIQIESSSNTIVKSISYVASKSGTDGTSSVVFRIYAPQGTVFSNQSGTLDLYTSAYYGATQITSSDASYKWQKVGSTDIIGTDSTKTIDGSDVANIATYKCTMTYPKTDGKEYIDVITLEDKSDTYISEMLAVGGTTFKNGLGGTFVYVKVRTNGSEVDQLLGDISTTTLQNSDGVEGQYYYYLNTASKEITLYKHNGTAWAKDTEDKQSLTYTWFLMDKDGNKSESFSKTGKIIYLSCDDIDSVGTLQCDVTNS